MISKKKKSCFSWNEANALLPDLAARLKRLQHKKEIYSRMHDTLFLHELVCVAERSGGFADPEDDLETGIHALEEAIEDLAQDVEMIFASGVILRDIERGRVEMPGELNGHKIYFSWVLGESEIRFYRRRDGMPEERLELPSSVLSR
ncbi:MAG: DUF2203 domain-containing protein [Candidatus Omnitrophica bacterium]|nr:DUF2203 domain-containing protein [Candidatus Omnitrophota bacterium]